uniref:Uncharacterized protein n=1 Tax=Anguilla anguilla TaxID=7936 RepID=A0A0E9QBR0_ANGAN
MKQLRANNFYFHTYTSLLADCSGHKMQV